MSTISFYACGKEPYNKLSNFALIEDSIEYNGLRFCSTEHAFQAQKYIEEQRVRFSVNGDLGNIGNMDIMFQLVFGDKWENKKKYWMKKHNIGIVAKMATNIKIGKKLGLIRDTTFISTDALWITILSSKFNMPTFKNILLSTNNAYLLEFDRGAKKTLPKWSGIIQDGILYGENLMGKYIMKIREKYQLIALLNTINKQNCSMFYPKLISELLKNDEEKCVEMSNTLNKELRDYCVSVVILNNNNTFGDYLEQNNPTIIFEIVNIGKEYYNLIVNACVK